MNVMLDKGAFAPERAHPIDGGLDLRSPVDAIVPAHGSCIIDTGVHVEIPENCSGVLISKSGLNVKHDLTSTGLIDQGYEGSIVVKLYNHGNNDYTICRGNKISQLVVVPVRYETVNIVESIFSNSERGENGFGSTGK